MTDQTNNPGAYENRAKIGDLTVAEFRKLMQECMRAERLQQDREVAARLQMQHGAMSGGNAYVNPASCSGNFWG